MKTRKFVKGAWYWCQWSHKDYGGEINVCRYEGDGLAFPWNAGGVDDGGMGSRIATKAFVRIRKVKDKCPYKKRK